MCSLHKEELAAPCGLYCGWCPYYITENKELKCLGCWKKKRCDIRDCAIERELKFCTFCQDFPCEKLYKMYARMSEFFDCIMKDFPKGVK
jgi:hypothetical protein